MKKIITGLGLVAMAGAAFAGTDTTFSVTATNIVNFLGGSLGLMLSLLALVVAVASAVAGKLTGVITALGVAISIQVGPTLVSAMFTGTI